MSNSPSSLSRREFVGAAGLLGVAALPLWPRLAFAERFRRDAAFARAAGATPLVVPFAPSRVRLHAGPVLDALQVNRKHLLAQEPDRLLHSYFNRRLRHSLDARRCRCR